MNDFLKEIIADKKQEIIRAKQIIPLSILQKSTEGMLPCRSMIPFLQNRQKKKKRSVIAEIKKKSPSNGIIISDFNPIDIAKKYQAAGAAAISVLTNEKYFGGRKEHLTKVKTNCKLPILRKDFIIDDYQVLESRFIGADAILLIMAALDEYQAAQLEKTAHACGLEVLVEVHDEKDMEKAQTLKTPFLGINNRNLHSFQTSIETSIKLASYKEPHHVVVSESGIKTTEDIEKLQKAGIHCFLIGESILRQKDVKKAVQQFIKKSI